MRLVDVVSLQFNGTLHKFNLVYEERGLGTFSSNNLTFCLRLLGVKLPSNGCIDIKLSSEDLFVLKHPVDIQPTQSTIIDVTILDYRDFVSLVCHEIYANNHSHWHGFGITEYLHKDYIFYAGKTLFHAMHNFESAVDTYINKGNDEDG